MERDNTEPSATDSNPTVRSGQETSSPRSAPNKKGDPAKIKKSSTGPSSSAAKASKRQKKSKSTPLDQDQIKVIQSEIQSQLSPLVAKLDLLLSERPTPNPSGTSGEPDNSLETEALEVRAPEQDSLYGSPERDVERQNWRLSSDKEGFGDYPSDTPAVAEEGSVAGDSATTEEVPSSFIELIEGVRTHLNIASEETPPPETKSFLGDAFSSVAQGTPKLVPVLPMDGVLSSKWKEVSASLPKLSTGRAKHNTMYRWGEDDFKMFGRVPKLDPEVEAFMASSQGSPKLRADLATMDDYWQKADMSIRHLQRVTSHSSLLLSLLGKGLQGEISVGDDFLKLTLETLATCLVDISELAVRVSARTILARRKLYLDAMNLASPSTKQELLKLPLQGPHLFQGEFQKISHKASEILRDARTAAAELNRSTPSKFYPSQGTHSMRRFRPYPRPSSRDARPRFGSPSSSYLKRGSSLQFQSRGRPFRSFRGSRGKSEF